MHSLRSALPVYFVVCFSESADGRNPSRPTPCGAEPREEVCYALRAPHV